MTNLDHNQHLDLNHHLDRNHRLDQAVRLETRVKYDKGLVEGLGGDLEVALKISFIISALIMIKM